MDDLCVEGITAHVSSPGSSFCQPLYERKKAVGFVGRCRPSVGGRGARRKILRLDITPS